MAWEEKTILSMLNNARPSLVDGWDFRETGCEEITVRHLAGCGYAELPREAAPILSMLDGSNTLNEVAARIMQQGGRMRHRAILAAVAGLYAAGLLKPLGKELDGFLASVSGQENSLTRLGRRMFGLSLLLPLRWTPKRALIGPGSSSFLVVLLVFLAAYAVSLLPYVSWLLMPAIGASVLGPRPGEGLFSFLAGVVSAMSLLLACRALLLAALGRTVTGPGLGLTALVPHLSAGLRDQAMLTSDERRFYHGASLALLGLASAGVSIVGLWTSSHFVFFAGLGFQAVLLADLSPLWDSDMLHLLEERYCLRGTKAGARRFVLRRLWRSLFSRTTDSLEGALVFLGTLRVLYVFLLVAVLCWLVPGALDAVTAVLMDRRTSPLELAVVVFAALYLLGALVYFILSLVTVLAAGLTQLVAPAKRQARPRRVRSAAEASIDRLAQDLMAIPPFSSMPPDLVLETLKRGRLESYRRGAVILRQGYLGHTCYALVTGRCTVEVEDRSGTTRQVATLEPGTLFGEVALLASSPRTATVKAAEDVEAIAIDRETFLTLVALGGWRPEEVLQKVRFHTFLMENELLHGISPAGMRRLVSGATQVPAKAGAVVVAAGEAGLSMFLIYQGECEVIDPSGHRVALLREGNYFGEIALMTGAPRTATVRCTRDCVLVELPAALYQDVIVKEFATGAMLDGEAARRLEGLGMCSD